MPKKSRKQRKLEKEKVLVIPDVINAEKQTCQHYYIRIESRYSKTYLKKKSKDFYVCSGCGKIFTNEQKDKIDVLCNYITALGEKRATEFSKLLSDDIMPCKFYNTLPVENRVYEPVQVTPESLVELYEPRRMKSKEETLQFIEELRKGNKKTHIKEIKVPEPKSETESEPDDFEIKSFLSWDRAYRNEYIGPHFKTEELFEMIRQSDSAEAAYEKVGKRLTTFKNATTHEFGNIIFQEDLFEYLLEKGLNNKTAYEMLELVKWSVIRVYYHNYGTYNKIPKHSGRLSNDFYDWFNKLNFLPSRSVIFELFEEKER